MSNEYDIAPTHGNKESTTLSVEVPQVDEDEELQMVEVEEDDEVIEEKNKNKHKSKQQQQKQKHQHNHEQEEEEEEEEEEVVEEEYEELNPQVTQTDEDRNKLGLNSPKSQQQAPPLPTNDQIPNDGGGALTPNTLRAQMGVNSPRLKKENPGWAGATQDENKSQSQGGGLSPNDLITQVSRDDQPLTQKNPDQETPTTQNKGLFSCFSCLLCCCSSKVDQTHRHIEKTVNDQNINKENQQSSSQQQVIQQVHQQQQQPQLNAPLSQQQNDYGNGNGDGNKLTPTHDISENEEEESQDTETEYSAGLLKHQLPEHKGKKCLVLDLDETLVHSSFKPISHADFIIPVEIDNVIHRVYVMKRPFVDDFLKECAKNYEIVVFTASLAKYADPLLDQLDPDHTIAHRLFRESCVLHGTAYVKDLRKIGRKLKDTIIVDNSPQSYIFQPLNAIPIATWFDDKSDTQLRELLPVLNTTLKNIKDVRKILNANEKSYKWLCDQHDKPLNSFNGK